MKSLLINMFTETQDKLTSHTHHPLPLPPWTHNIMSHQQSVCVCVCVNNKNKIKAPLTCVWVLYASELITACVQMAGAACSYSGCNYALIVLTLSE